MMGLAGGAAFWGVLLGAPVTGAVLAYELTQNIKIVCCRAGWPARSRTVSGVRCGRGR